MTVTVDPGLGGRWTSLRLAGREWLWRRHAPEREHVAPGDAFVDAGGLEECLPTVRGHPDHGDVWSRPWTRVDDTTLAVECADFRLERSLEATPSRVTVGYHLTARPGYRFVWAAHALLDLSPSARVGLPDGTAVRVFPEAAGLLADGWPAGAPHRTGVWPRPLGLDLGRLGPDDGTAVGAVAVDCPSVTVVDGPHELTMSLTADGAPRSVALWRNLGGFPLGNAYRSVGVEPMLGRVFDLGEAAPGDAVTVPTDGSVRWRLVVSATRRAVAP